MESSTSSELFNSFSITGYKIINKIGEGGMGSVWRAVQESTSREVAIKILDHTVSGSRRSLLRFEREVELVASLKHPNIACLYESGLDRGRYYYAMELISGKHLDEYVKINNLLQEDILILFCKVCSAITYAHQLGIIHRDIKPSNIMVDENGEPFLLDFGLAKNIFETSPKVSLSLDGEFFGTLQYMSPEQAAGNFDQIDTRSDIYSLGILLYKLLAERFPYHLDGSFYDIAKTIQTSSPFISSKYIKDADLRLILNKALEKDPDLRYQSVSELENDIQCFIAGQPISVYGGNTFYLIKKIITKHKSASIILILLLVIFISLSSISIRSYLNEISAKAQLETARIEFGQDTDVLALYSKERVFFDCLLEWNPNKASFIERYLEDGTREKDAIQFLLDKRGIEEKLLAFSEKLEAHGKWFRDFIIAEAYLINNYPEMALKYYRKSLSEFPKQEITETNDITISFLKSRIFDLSN